MTSTQTTPASVTFPALGTTAVLLVTDAARLQPGQELLRRDRKSVV